MASSLLLAPCASPVRKTAFEQLTISGIDRMNFRSVFSTYDERVIHVFILPANTTVDNLDLTDSFALFYQGANEYTWAARILEVREHQKLANDILETTDVSEDEWMEFGEEVLVLETPFPISVRSHNLHQRIGTDQDALTRLLTVSDEQLTALEQNYGSLREYLLDHRREPTIWVERTELQGRPYKQEGGEFELGTAVFSRSRAKKGARVYETLRKADVGDIVIHLLQDRYEIVGVSVVTSTLQEDFEGPPDDSWDAEARGSGYFRALARYQSLSDPIAVYDDLLDAAEYQTRLQDIYEAYDGLFYDKNQDLAQGAYFTRVPIEILYLFIAEAPDLLQLLSDRYYRVPLPDSVEEYSSVNETVADIRVRLAFTTRDVDWFQFKFAESVVRALTTTLAKLESNTQLTPEQGVHCELIAHIYEDLEDDLERTSTELEIGRTNRLAPPRSLFFVLFRELQHRAGVSANMDHVKTRTILDENYSVESPRSPITRPDDVEPLPESDATKNAESIARQLTEVGQLVFYGPPGTSKTYTAQRFARWWLHQQADVDPTTEHLMTVTFHPSFTYEDFLEGLSAEVTDENTVAYEHEPGVFKSIADRARDAYLAAEKDDETAPRYVLIIDEINRGNLAQIFGETMTTLEYDKRLGQENETTVSLSHTSSPFTVPPNLYLIGTMNTADRSIALVDAALRRRFRFISFPPDFEALVSTESVPFDSLAEVGEAATDSSQSRRLLARSILAVLKLNRRIIDTPDLGKGKQIGHSYFFGVDTTDAVVDVWRYEILPLLEEYYFGQFDRIRNELFDGSGSTLLDWDSEEIRDFDADDLDEMLDEFVEQSDIEPYTSEESEYKTTLNYLLDAGVLSDGDRLIFNESKIPDDATREFDADDPFWQCEITGKRGQSDNVRWLEDDTEHSLSGLAKQILNDVSELNREVSGSEHWMRDGTRLWVLRQEHEEG